MEASVTILKNAHKKLFLQGEQGDLQRVPRSRRMRILLELQLSLTQKFGALGACWRKVLA